MNATLRFTPRILPTLAILLNLVLLSTGCVSNRYRKSPRDTPPPQLLNMRFASAPLEGPLASLITYNGPGSWKRNVFWDEYVVTLHNPGGEPLTVSSIMLIDYAGTSRTPGNNAWALKKQSKSLE